MKRYAVVLIVALVACAASFGLTRRLSRPDTGDQMAWLRHEFHLNDEQAAQITQLNAAYEPICANHCERIAAARDRLRTLEIEGKKNGPEYEAATADWNALRAECSRATRQQLERVAAVMSPDEGRRYLDMIGAKLTKFDHSKPFGLQ
ncbi:hypothetical protein DB347_21510 [Opitutaceae bacterium EW11]|nr:hypothetical protein DB347_21510 [Opitutaceae bacterium EW11]